MSDDDAAKKCDGWLKATISGAIERVEDGWIYPAVNIRVRTSNLGCEDNTGRMVNFSVSFHHLLVELAPEETSRARLKGEFLPLPDNRKKGRWVLRKVRNIKRGGMINIATRILSGIGIKAAGEGSLSFWKTEEKREEWHGELVDTQVDVYHEDTLTIHLEITPRKPPLKCNFGLPNDALCWRVKEEGRGNLPCRMELRMMAAADAMQFHNIKLPDHRLWERLTANKKKLAQAVFQEILRLRTGEEQEIDQHRRPNREILIHRQFLELKDDNTQ